MRLLDDAALDRVYVDLVRPLLFEDLSASAAPELIMVGGQPGAGKTAATVQAVRDLMRRGGGVAYINGDELRPFHPKYAALVAADWSTAADKTGADVGLWVERAIREAAAGRFHAVIETTMRQPKVVRRTAEQFTAQGFRFEMRVVVVDPEASQLGIYERFATGLASPSALPRFTLPSYHADALAQMPKTLAEVVKLAKIVRFVDRQGRELYSSRASKVSPVKALEDFRRQPMPEGERQRIAHQWETLAQRLDRDGVPDMVRRGVKTEHTRFIALQEKGRGHFQHDRGKGRIGRVDVHWGADLELLAECRERDLPPAARSRNPCSPASQFRCGGNAAVPVSGRRSRYSGYWERCGHTHRPTARRPNGRYRRCC